MVVLLIGVTWATVVALLIARAVVQFRHYIILEPCSTEPANTPGVTVIVPARDEAQRIGRCLDGLLAQNWPDDRLRLIVVDDRSSDNTAEIVARVAANDDRVTLVSGRPLPPGWTGKAFACWQGAQCAATPWLCYVDADTLAGSRLVATAVGEATRERLDLLSLEPCQDLGSFAERMILPAGFLLCAFFLDLRATHDPSAPSATANGQFMLIRRAAYANVGGHAAVRGEIAEDSRLAEHMKALGYRVAVRGGEKLIRTRMYLSFGALWHGLSRNAIELAGGSARAVGFGFCGLLVGWACWLVPLGLWARGSEAAPALGQGLALAASVAFLGLHAAAHRHLGTPIWYALLIPFAYTATAMVAIKGVHVRCWGTVTWKGRRYRPTHRTDQRYPLGRPRG